MTFSEYQNFALSVTSRIEAVNRLNNSVLEDEGVVQIYFGANKTPAEIIKEGSFGVA